MLLIFFFQGCDLVIALTHMRTPNDIKLAEGVDDIDIILGGHDHVYELLHVSYKTYDFAMFYKFTYTAKAFCVLISFLFLIMKYSNYLNILE